MSTPSLNKLNSKIASLRGELDRPGRSPAADAADKSAAAAAEAAAASGDDPVAHMARAYRQKVATLESDLRRRQEPVPLLLLLLL